MATGSCDRTCRQSPNEDLPISPEIRFTALSTAVVTDLRDGLPDAHGMAPEGAVSDGGGNPCRHCLEDIPAGAGMLVLAHRPFPAPQPYAEVGPIFLCADACARWEGEGLPPVVARRARHLLKGYGADDRIVYGTGRIVETAELAGAAAALLADPRVRYAHVRSASNNCYTCRVDLE